MHIPDLLQLENKESMLRLPHPPSLYYLQVASTVFFSSLLSQNVFPPSLPEVCLTRSSKDVDIHLLTKVDGERVKLRKPSKCKQQREEQDEN